MNVACPQCGSDVGYQEIGKKLTWQNVELDFNEKGSLDVSDYVDAWDYGDDFEPTGYSCRACEMEWPSLAELAAEVVAARTAHWLSLARTALTDPRALDVEPDALIEPGYEDTPTAHLAYALARIDDAINALTPKGAE